ncbi:MAG: hypothetical protein CVU06_07175 [Bacteroidetes bacterium HGW-Bacteroidetes-22]|nr:MAG: hypothetical protein CVU06_07175 [Bacteroidetes bacterium HGW-Bacteroidetes-22]
MKKIISIILISCFLFNICSYQVLFTALQNHIQREIRQKIREGLADDDLTLVMVPEGKKSEIVWLKQDKEFELNGEMYDVVKTKVIDQKRYYYCVCDIKEKQLIANYNKTHNNWRNRTSILKKKIGNPLFFQHLMEIDCYYFSDFCAFSKPTGIIAYYLNIPSPPPKLV